MSTNVWQQKEWIDYTNYVVDYLEASRGYKIYDWNKQDWQDFKQQTLLHIWNKREKYNPDLPLKPWLKTIISFQFRNTMRNDVFCVTTLRVNTEAKKNVKRPQPIVTRSVELEGDDEEVVYEPDAMAPAVPDNYSDIISTLPEKEQKIVKLSSEGYKIIEIAKELKISTKYVDLLKGKIKKTLKKKRYS